MYHIYDKEFRPSQKGIIGIDLHCSNHFDEKGNTLIPHVAFQFDCGWVAHPIFSKEGNYPQVMRDRISDNSKIQGLSESKLPEFTQQEIEYIK